jgi:uncharacterized OB-fold protein
MTRVLPQPTKVSQPFWDACRRGEFIIQKCTSCGSHLFYPVRMCPDCSSLELSWVPASGRGTIYSLSTLVQATDAEKNGPPTILALVALAEGPVMMSNIVGEGAEAARIGDSVAVEFTPVSDEISLPMFHRI